MINNSFDNYNLFIFAIILLVFSFVLNDLLKKAIYILCILLLGIFINFQFKLFYFKENSDFEDYKIIITNYLFALFSGFLILNLIYYSIY